MTDIGERDREKFEARLMTAKRVSQAIIAEQGRIVDRIEHMIEGTESTEVVEALVSVARYILDGGRNA